MSSWHRENPELVGTWHDPWMQHEGYRKALGLNDQGVPVDRDEDDVRRSRAKFDRKEAQ